MEPSLCTSPRQELSKDTKNIIWRSLFGGSHNYKTEQNKLPSFIDRWQGQSVTHPLFAYTPLVWEHQGMTEVMTTCFWGQIFCHLVTKNNPVQVISMNFFGKKRVSKSPDIRNLDNRSPNYSGILNFFLLCSITCKPNLTNSSCGW
jgi:hypothetical protein